MSTSPYDPQLTAQIPVDQPQPIDIPIASPYGAQPYAVPQQSMAYSFPQPFGGMVPPIPRPDPHWGWVIGAFIMFWPVAIAACINAARVDSSWMAGDFYGAQRQSEDAEKFGKIGVFVGVGMIALVILMYVIMFIVLFSLARPY